jgi:hypothetical protein
MSACPQCGSVIIKAANRPRKFCSTPCQIKAANSRRASTRSGRKTDPRSAPLQPVDRATVTRIAPSVDRSLSALPDAPAKASTPPLTHRNGIAKVGDRIRIWVDSPVLGSGERHLMVTAITKTTVHLYSVAALREIIIARSEFEQCAESYGSNPKIVLGLLEVNLRSYARSGLEHDRPSAHAMDALREMAK